VGPGGAETHIVGGDDGPSLLHHRLVDQVVGRAIEGVGQDGGSAPFGEARCAMGPTDHREGIGAECRWSQDDPAGDRRNPFGAGGGVEDAPGLGTFGNRRGEGFGAEQDAGLDGQVGWRIVEIVGLRDSGPEPAPGSEQGDRQNGQHPGPDGPQAPPVMGDHWRVVV
jgi:hypothetical protein